MTATDFINFGGLFGGPVFGVLIAVWLQRRADLANRRLSIFKTLMRTRRTPLAPAYVEALNLVEVEFYGDSLIISNYNQLINHFSEGFRRRDEEEHRSGDSVDTLSQRDQTFGLRMYNERQDLATRLIHSIGVKLGYKLEQLDVIKGGYNPKLYADLESEQQEIRRYIVALSRGERTIPISVLPSPIKIGDDLPTRHS